MKVVSGIDLVYLPRFKKALKSGGENFLRRVFLESELDNAHLRGEVHAVRPDHHLGGGSSFQHLAGIFAAKEAVIKALGLPPGSWQDIVVNHKSDGAPKVSWTHHSSLITDHSLSLSHDGQYVIAQFVASLKK